MFSILPSELLLVFGFAHFAVAAPKNIWAIHIDNSPVPPPDQVPPAAQHAIRDPAYLKYQIAAIAGAYGLWLIFALVAIVCVGNRLRRKAQTSNGTLRMEILKPTGGVTVREIAPPVKSPKSPSKFSFKSWGKSHKSSESQTTLNTVDDRVISDDRARNLDEMTMLYAAVMAHDDEKARSSGSSPITNANSPITPRTPRSPEYPPEYQHLRQAQNQALMNPMAPTPTSNDFVVPDMPSSRTKAMKSPVSSVFSTATHNSTDPRRAQTGSVTVRGQPISGPVGSADLNHSAAAMSQMSLAERVYTPGPPPPTPGKNAATTIQSREIKTRAPPPSALPLASETSNNSQSSLPFRQFYGETLKSAPATKTTFLDRSTSKFNGPMTGIPSTPYTPYQPNTPLTPLTPRRLMTREELKKNKKQYAMKVVVESDMVQTDDDVWGGS